MPKYAGLSCFCRLVCLDKSQAYLDANQLYFGVQSSRFEGFEQMEGRKIGFYALMTTLGQGLASYGDLPKTNFGQD